MLIYYLASELPKNFPETGIEQINITHLCPRHYLIISIVLVHFIIKANNYVYIMSLSVYFFSVIVIVVVHVPTGHSSRFGY